MNKFILKVLSFLCLLGVFIVIIEGLLPCEYFTNRPWETLRVRNDNLFNGAFYPSCEIVQSEVGDLGHHTVNSVLRKDIKWITDELGYRNNTKAYKGGIIIIGDSNIAGSSIDQNKILSRQLAQKLKTPVYNLAPAHINHFFYLLENELIPKPSLLIQGVIERNIGKLSNIDRDIIDEEYSICLRKWPTISKVIDKVFYKQCFRNRMKSRLRNSVGRGKLSTSIKGMLFLEGKKSNKFYTKKQIDNHASRIEGYSKTCKKYGIQYVFFPIPNKETVYFEGVPYLNQPSYLHDLRSNLKRKGVLNLNTIELFNKDLKDRNKLVYHLDDSHWNSYGITLTSKGLFNLIKKHEIRYF